MKNDLKHFFQVWLNQDRLQKIKRIQNFNKLFVTGHKFINVGEKIKSMD